MTRTLLIDASLATLLTSTLLLASCATPDAPPPPNPVDATPTEAVTKERALPLPPGAELDPPAGEPDEPFVPQELEWEGSLAPRSVSNPNGDDPTPTLERIRKRGRLIVGIDQSLYLLSFRDTATGELRGFEVDLAHQIADDIFEGMDPSQRPGETGWVDFRFVDSAARSELLKRGEVDVIIRTMSITPERAKEIEFSTPYLAASVRMLAPRDRGIDGTDTIGDLAGKTVCLVDGTNLLRIAQTYTPESSILRTRTWSDCLMATQQFQADAIVADDAILAGIAAQDPYVELLPGSVSKQYYGVGMPKNQPDLTRRVNATLERMRIDGTWNRLYSQWLTGAVEASTPPPPMYREEER